jgi:3-dehydroquinate synthase
MTGTLDFQFGAFPSSVHIGRELPSIGCIAERFDPEGRFFKPLIICDQNTQPLAEKIIEQGGLLTDGQAGESPRCVLEPGEAAKNWTAVETILRAAADGGLGRDGVFIGVGGGVIGDLAAFGASIYMRGCGLCLVSTTLLGMVDASLGGKTGFDLFGVKNLAGSFYPARHVYMPLESLETLPPAEWKSGMAELIKTAILAGGDFLDLLESLRAGYHPDSFLPDFPGDFIRRTLDSAADTLGDCIFRAAALKGRIVAADPRETGEQRRLLNLGHSFGHALESAAGLGTVSHGEAVAWGMVRACELGRILGITPPERAERITTLLRSLGYQISAPHPRLKNDAAFFQALGRDKKKSAGQMVYIVPDGQSARTAAIESDALLKEIVNGACSKTRLVQTKGLMKQALGENC